MGAGGRIEVGWRQNLQLGRGGAQIHHPRRRGRLARYAGRGVDLLAPRCSSGQGGGGHAVAGDAGSGAAGRRGGETDGGAVRCVRAVDRHTRAHRQRGAGIEDFFGHRRCHRYGNGARPAATAAAVRAAATATTARRQQSRQRQSAQTKRKFESTCGHGGAARWNGKGLLSRFQLLAGTVFRAWLCKARGLLQIQKTRLDPSPATGSARPEPVEGLVATPAL